MANELYGVCSEGPQIRGLWFGPGGALGNENTGY